MGKGEVWEENGGETGKGMEVRETGTPKIAPKRNIFGIWGRPLGATAPCHTFLESFFRDNISVTVSRPMTPS